jgi:hypothetical protein
LLFELLPAESNQFRNSPVQLGMRTTTDPRSTGWSFLMSFKSRIAALALATLAVTGSIASTTTSAEAKGFGWGWGVGAGLVGAAIVGSAIAASNDGYYYDGYRRCGWVRQFDAYGNYIGRVRSCY